ncbi:MAG: acyl-[acyl-carrier-protein] thioesterase [Lachnospiraceae bacterium]|jgi:acyl-ACP thioesterase|nr:acyl-[acyl-carrier-protein] thioesterase [Lachnospiraceae bacterium]
MKYSIDSTVRFSEIGVDGKLTLPGIVNYFQDTSVFHSESIGDTIGKLKRQGNVWILSSWQIEIKRYPILREKIKVSTWASGFKGCLGYRNFTMEDENHEIIAFANSLWVYMDLDAMRPSKITKDEVDAYGEDEAYPMGELVRKVNVPKETFELPRTIVKQSDLDTNFHMNNGQYIRVALDALEIFFQNNPDKKKNIISSMRAEYKLSAKFQDVIIPYVYVEEEKAVVDLRNGEGNTYAAVEFIYEE